MLLFVVEKALCYQCRKGVVFTIIVASVVVYKAFFLCQYPKGVTFYCRRRRRGVVCKALFLSPSKRRYFYHRRKGVIACLPQQRDAAIKFSITCSALRQCIVRWQIHRSTVLCGFMAVGEVLRTYGHVWNFRLEDLRGKPGELPHERTGGQSTGLPPIQRV